MIVALYFPLLVGDLDATGTPVFGPISITLVSLTAVALATGLMQSKITTQSDTASRT